jgi:DNA-binding NarL/FixJ family response regulator
MFIEAMSVPKKQIDPRRRVLIVEGGSLLEESLQALLSREPDLQVMVASFADETAFLRDVAATRPDVILMSESGPLTSERMVELLKRVPALTWLRVIAVRPQDNTINVYEHQRVVINEVGDLLNLVRSAVGDPG